MSSNTARENLARSERAVSIAKKVVSPASMMTWEERPNGGSFSGTEEPLLSDLLSDPLTHRMMESDGVKQRHLLLVIAEVQARLNGA